MYTKHIKYTDKRSKKAAELEVELQTIAARHGLAPAVISSSYLEDECVICMENAGQCLAALYSDDSKKIPKAFWQQIRHILEVLYEVEGIEYIDITSYNFTEKNGKIYIIDFGDAYYTKKSRGEKPANWFLRDFLEGAYEWNPDFA
jgi:tRNA A-37 threonylcarbamoyl transferase component Bud32